MEHAFWHDKWARKEIGFHLPEAHPWLVKHIESHPLSKNDVVFVPLCGKTHDIGLFLKQGVKVIANELSESAIVELFSELGLTPKISSWKDHGQCYQADLLTVYVGDFFKLTQDELKDVTRIYDRAAIVALPDTMRAQYSEQLKTFCVDAKHWLMTLEYDQDKMSGPPFSVTEAEVIEHYGNSYQINTVIRRDVIDQEPRFKEKGLSSFVQCFYELEPSK